MTDAIFWRNRDPQFWLNFTPLLYVQKNKYINNMQPADTTDKTVTVSVLMTNPVNYDKDALFFFFTVSNIISNIVYSKFNALHPTGYKKEENDENPLIQAGNYIQRRKNQTNFTALSSGQSITLWCSCCQSLQTQQRNRLTMLLWHVTDVLNNSLTFVLYRHADCAIRARPGSTHLFIDLGGEGTYRLCQNNNLTSSLHVTLVKMGLHLCQTVRYQFWGMSDGAVKSWWLQCK